MGILIAQDLEINFSILINLDIQVHYSPHLQACFIASRFRSKGVNFYRSIRMKKLCFCSLPQNTDNRKTINLSKLIYLGNRISVTFLGDYVSVEAFWIEKSLILLVALKSCYTVCSKMWKLTIGLISPIENSIYLLKPVWSLKMRKK